ncbi:hypothetical protein [Aurantiacibacter flavus]|uniref:Uncharacterized protein n=1 Tax=Aurantiacibacter flavus TaxID=3145232 RepID=A0ABV0CUY5_9SPHN
MQPVKQREYYTFVVGPQANWTDGDDQRFQVRMPASYVELTPEQMRQDKIEVGQFTFAVRYPSGEPVPHDQLAGRDVVLLTVSWDPGGAVEQRIDGSWQNYYSRYNVAVEDDYNMRQFKAPEVYDDSRLFVDKDQKTMIECKHIMGKKLMPCRLLHNDGGHVTIGASFSRELLSDWHDIVALSRELIQVSDLEMEN